MNQTIYIETTIPSSYHDDRPEPEMVARQHWTRQWWDGPRDQYSLFTSVAVLDELRRGRHPGQDKKLALVEGLPLLEITREVVEIAEVYIERFVMPSDPAGDALHLALVTFYALESRSASRWSGPRARFELFTSELVLAEAGQGDPDAAQRRGEKLQGIPDLEVTDEVVALAKRLVNEGAVPREAMDDAIHIAVAAVHGVDYLLTWNCRHLDNAERKPLVRSVCSMAGYRCPEICTPQELMGEQEND